jgi:metal-sulfur cluster biosynthetic enzyme
MTSVSAVVDALAGVRDPELDQGLVELGFVTSVEVDGDLAEVRLRLPTYFCAPNFSYLMVADARRAVEAVEGVRTARIALDDHFAADEINAAVGRGATFAEAFPGQAVAELDELRALFQRKALTARQGRLYDELRAAGRNVEEIAGMRLTDLPPGDDADRCRELRRALGIDAGPGAPAFVLPNGDPVTVEAAPRFVRFARLVGRSLDGNAHLCRSLLRTRYDLPTHEEVAA